MKQCYSTIKMLAKLKQQTFYISVNQKCNRKFCTVTQFCHEKMSNAIEVHALLMDRMLQNIPLSHCLGRCRRYVSNLK